MRTLADLLARLIAALGQSRRREVWLLGAAAVVVLVMIGRGGGDVTGANPAAPPGDEVTIVEDEPPPPTVENTVAPEHGEHTQPDAAPIREAARAYLDTFYTRDMTTGEWRTALAALSTDYLAGLNETVPRSAVPDVQVVDVRVERVASSAATVTASLSDGTSLDVGLVLDVDGWKVSRVAPVPPEGDHG